ncbi:unnamed protein product [marine sediment metagenome]|uniref:Transmembrane protein n=1 Tax=marine sediment metagenome TaxID=412755 RepID=X1EH80_9ZZZZ
MLKQHLKEHWIWYAFIFGLSALSISIVSISLCDFTKTEYYPASFSGTLIGELNKTIFVGNPTYSGTYPLYICKGKLSEYKRFDNIDKEKDNCQYSSIKQGIPYNNIIEDIKIQLNNKEFEITQRGFFCLQ